MDAHFLSEFSHVAKSHGVYAEDFADRLCSRYTSIGLLTLAAVSVMRQYVFKPIQCWVPANWPRPWEEFAENFCWTQNTYRVAMSDSAHPEARERGAMAISYYQWVPIMLMVQALLCMAPHQLWLMTSRRISGFDPHSVLRFAAEVEQSGNPETSKRLLTYAAWHLAWSARFRGQPIDQNRSQTKQRQDQKQSRSRGCSEKLRQSGCALFWLYIVCKLVHAGLAVGQIFLLQSFLGFNSPLFGWKCAKNLLLGGQWQQTGVFPRLTFCDLPMRHVGQWNVHSVQCVLASNMVNEKIFIFLWFWFGFCCLASLVYTASWLAQLLPPTDRRRLVRRHLRLHAGHARGNSREPIDASADRLFRLLRLDGALLLQMVADNLDCLCAAQLLDRLLTAADRARDVGVFWLPDSNSGDSGLDSESEQESLNHAKSQKGEMSFLNASSV